MLYYMQHFSYELRCLESAVVAESPVSGTLRERMNVSIRLFERRTTNKKRRVLGKPERLCYDERHLLDNFIFL